MRYTLFTIFFLVLIGCSQEKIPVFGGEVIDVKSIDTMDSLKGSRITFKDVYTGYMSVYDSLMLFVSDKYPDCYLKVFSLNTGELIGSFCKKGDGPGEFKDFTHAEQFKSNANEIKLFGYDNLDNFYCLNLSKSILSHQTKIDTAKKLKWNQAHTRLWSFAFQLSDDLFLAKSQPEYLFSERKDFILPSYYKFNSNIDNVEKIVKLYNRMPYEGQELIDADQIFYSLDRLKPDKSKIAMVMQSLCQVNILDLKNDKLKGFRLKNTPGFTLKIKENSQVNNGLLFYYIDICVDDTRIYALCSNKTLGNHPFQSNEVHVFDWNGNFIRKLILTDGIFDQIALDPVNSLLYAKNDEEIVYRYYVKR